jgi:hypothetical protein
VIASPDRAADECRCQSARNNTSGGSALRSPRVGTSPVGGAVTLPETIRKDDPTRVVTNVLLRLATLCAAGIFVHAVAPNAASPNSTSNWLHFSPSTVHDPQNLLPQAG